MSMDVGAYSMWWARQQPQWLVYINDADRLAHVVVSRYQQKCQQTASMLNAGVQRLAAAGRKTLVGTNNNPFAELGLSVATVDRM